MGVLIILYYNTFLIATQIMTSVCLEVIIVHQIKRAPILMEGSHVVASMAILRLKMADARV